MRLQKFLSAAGVCSRRKGEKYIQAGKIKVNGETITRPGVKVDPENDRVEFQGKRIELRQRPVYIALNKPRGYITSCKHPGARIVTDIPDIPERIFPVGRLDKDSTGLLLLTNDGGLHHKLSHPSFNHEKEYDVLVENPISNRDLHRMADGMPILGSLTRPARVKRISSKRFRIVLKEGRNKQIRRMVQDVGNQVCGLQRIRVSNILLGKLGPGEWRYLTEKEKDNLLGNDKGTNTGDPEK